MLKSFIQRGREGANGPRAQEPAPCRPDAAVFVYDLKPLTTEQQQAVLRSQLPMDGELSPGHFVEQLFRSIESRNRFDELCSDLGQAALTGLAGIPAFDRTAGEQGIVQVTGAGPAGAGAGAGAATRPVRDADELLAAAAAAHPTIRRALEAAAARMDLPVVGTADALREMPGRAGLVFAPPKKKARIEEKMLKNHGKPSPPAAYVLDVARATAVLPTAEAVAQFYASLNHPEEGVQVVRLKNYFSAVDETHYRRLQCVIKVLVPPAPGEPELPDPELGLYHLAEVQIQLVEAFFFSRDNEHLCHTPYEYFRRLFKGGQMKAALNEGGGGWMSLDAALTAWAGLFETPVVLAMFVRVLANLDFAKPESIRLLTTKVELYRAALATMLSRAAGLVAAQLALAAQPAEDAPAAADEGAQVEATLLETLAAVACHNQLGDAGAVKRVFSQRDAEKALAGQPDQLAMFAALVGTAAAGPGGSGDEYRIPGFKVLESAGDGEGTLLQATHLSFQEYLTGVFLGRNPDAVRSVRTIFESRFDGAKSFLQKQANLATLLPARVLFALVFRGADTVDLSGAVDDELVEAIGRALSSNASNPFRLQSLVLKKCYMEALPDSLGLCVHLQTLNLYGCTSLKTLPGSIGSCVELRELDLRNCESLETLPESLGSCAALESLHLQDCVNLQSLPVSLGSCAVLRSLTLSDCSQLMRVPDLRKLVADGGLDVEGLPHHLEPWGRAGYSAFALTRATPPLVQPSTHTQAHAPASTDTGGTGNSRRPQGTTKQRPRKKNGKKKESTWNK